MFSLDNHYTLLKLQTDHLTKKKHHQTNKLLLLYLQNAGNACKLQPNLDIVHNDLDFLKIVISTYRNNTLSSSP